jgi:hypothetical protein
MTKNADGVWSVSTPPAVPGFHYYWFVLDGVSVNDPGSETYVGYGKETSGIEVPEAGVDFYAVKDVPHGDVRANWYLSKVTGVVWFILRRITTTTQRRDIQYSYCSMALEKMRWAGRNKDERILFSIISSARARPSQ